MGWAACLGESMLQLPRVRCRLLACYNGASPNCIVVVVVNSPCSGRSSPHVVFLQLLTKSSSRATCAFSLSTWFWRPRIAWLCTLGTGLTLSFALSMAKAARAAPVASLRLLQPPFRSDPRLPCPLDTCLSSGRDRLAHRCRATLRRLEPLACRLLCCNWCRRISSNLLELILVRVVVLLQMLHILSQLRDL